ncbi:MAG: cadherin repeat domain-containing protein, partial [Hyphomicrobiales bacterium]
MADKISNSNGSSAGTKTEDQLSSANDFVLTDPAITRNDSDGIGVLFGTEGVQIKKNGAISEESTSETTSGVEDTENTTSPVANNSTSSGQTPLDNIDFSTISADANELNGTQGLPQEPIDSNASNQGIQTDGVDVVDSTAAFRSTVPQNDTPSNAARANGQGLESSETVASDIDPTTEPTSDTPTVDDGPQAPINNQPTDLEVSDNTFAENSVAGTVVATLTASDVDGDSFSFSIVGDSDEFEIIGNQIVVSEGADFDFETTSPFTLTILVNDGNGGVLVEDITFDVTNVNEAPTDLVIDGSSVDENVAAGTVVASLSVSDVDAGDSHTFEL